MCNSDTTIHIAKRATDSGKVRRYSTGSGLGLGEELMDSGIETECYCQRREVSLRVYARI